VKYRVDPLENNFLKECNIVVAWKCKFDNGDNLSDSGDNVVQSTKRYGHPKKCVKKPIMAGRRNEFFGFLGPYFV